MTKTVENLMEFMAIRMAETRPGEICTKCRDKSICDSCLFCHIINPPEK